jgi:hypothetical protein
VVRPKGSRAAVAVVLALSVLLTSVTIAQASTTYFGQGQDSADIAYRPDRLLVAGEGSFYVGKMKWSTWTNRVARGHGIGAQDDCDPGCSDGTFHRAPARIRLWRPRRKCGHEIFTRMTLTWSHGPPSGIPGYSRSRRQHWKLAVFPCI